MSFYSVDVSCKVEIGLTTKYECENCGQASSYYQTYDQIVSKSGQTSRKSQTEARSLSKKLSIEAQEYAQELEKDWKKDGPSSFQYHISYEMCPHCGYYQSWMQKHLKDKSFSKYIKWPLLIVSFAWFLLYVNLLERTFLSLVGDYAPTLGIGLWVVLAGITFLIGKYFRNYKDTNRKFKDVDVINEPTFIWGECKITNS